MQWRKHPHTIKTFAPLLALLWAQLTLEPLLSDQQRHIYARRSQTDYRHPRENPHIVAIVLGRPRHPCMSVFLVLSASAMMSP
ncbi:hypothetical protein BDV25DRAFT_161311 [Aspergillus avenaceus]|uniref:Secreted protein n=1 Tax=Aspergillus avenaceus TaxID=36643 RepID=A0A5N6TKZ1_ASPAV|nr:hypothetical protein BDV25DRAFT_161311 [Aspergillus avenaceus]